MPYIAGTSIPKDKILVQAISTIYGLGLSESKKLCKKAGFGSDARGKDVNYRKSRIIEKFAEATLLPLGADLRRFEKDKILRLCTLSTYRGLRHRKSLPVRGQRTHTNAKKRPPLNLKIDEV